MNSTYPFAISINEFLRKYRWTLTSHLPPLRLRSFQIQIPNAKSALNYLHVCLMWQFVTKSLPHLSSGPLEAFDNVIGL